MPRSFEQISPSNDRAHDTCRLLESTERASCPAIDIDTPIQRIARDNGALISSISNFSIQYNLGVIAPALLLLDPRGTSSSTNDPAYPRSDNIDSILKSSVFAGAILGQSTMGFVGDAIGLELAMIATNLLSVMGTLGCALAPVLGQGDPLLVYTILAVSRGVMGVGVGGKYPLASAMRAETAEDGEGSTVGHRSREVAKGFFWQTPGAIFPYFVSFFILLCFGGDATIGKDHMTSTNMQYIILVGVGAIPSFVILFLTWNRYRLSPAGKNNHKVKVKCTDKKKTYWRKLAGTGLSWALYDFVYYGTALNQPEIISRIFQSDGGLVQNSLENAVLGMMGIPGVICAIKMIEPMGPKPLQGWGFVLIGISSVALALSYRSDGGGRWSGMIALSCLIFSLNWGCNVSTYVLPMEIFPREVRSSYHGLSAAMGKIGALIGSFSFTQLNAVSVYLTFYACALSCLIGVFVTWRFIDPPRQNVFFQKKEHHSVGPSSGAEANDGSGSDQLQQAVLSTLQMQAGLT